MARDGQDGDVRRDGPPLAVLARVKRLRELMGQLAVIVIELEDLVRGIRPEEPTDEPRGG